MRSIPSGERKRDSQSRPRNEWAQHGAIFFVLVFAPNVGPRLFLVATEIKVASRVNMCTMGSEVSGGASSPCSLPTVLMTRRRAL